MQFEFATLATPKVLGALLLLSLLLFLAFSIAVIYHWKEYGMRAPLIKLATPLYLSVSVVLCIFAIISYLALI